MGFFYLGPLLGPFLGPIIGGLLAGKFGWRSTQWFLTIYGAILLIFILFALPETLQESKPSRIEMQNPRECPSSDRLGLSRVQSCRSLQQSTRKGMSFMKRALIDPLKILLYLRFPAVLITVSSVSVAFGALYLINVSIEWTFSKPPYNYSAIIIGLCYIPSSVGYFLASIFGGRWTDAIMAREARKAGRYDSDGKLMYQPEDRMRENAWIAAFLYPSALIWYGWTAEAHISSVVPVSLSSPRGLLCPKCSFYFSFFVSHTPCGRSPPIQSKNSSHTFFPIYSWGEKTSPILTTHISLYPFLFLTFSQKQLIANFFFGVGSMLIFGMATTMLTEFMPRKASAGVAANNFVRNIVSSVCAFAAEPLLRAIGNGWLFTIIGVIAMASSAVVWAMRRFGPRWRVAMKKALDEEG